MCWSNIGSAAHRGFCNSEILSDLVSKVRLSVAYCISRFSWFFWARSYCFSESVLNVNLTAWGSFHPMQSILTHIYYKYLCGQITITWLTNRVRILCETEGDTLVISCSLGRRKEEGEKVGFLTSVAVLYGWAGVLTQGHTSVIDGKEVTAVLVFNIIHTGIPCKIQVLWYVYAVHTIFYKCKQVCFRPVSPYFSIIWCIMLNLNNFVHMYVCLIHKTLLNS